MADAPERPLAGESEPDVEEVCRQIGRELLGIHIDTYGKGAAEAKVYIHEDSVLVILDGLELQKNEEFMIEKGMGANVVQIRSGFQEAIETTFRAAVERATGRKVVSFASITKLAPNYVAELFRLAPAEDPILADRGAVTDE